MSFETVKKDILIQAAEEFGVDITKATTRPLIIAALTEDGVTWEMYKSAFVDIDDIPSVLEDEPTKEKPVSVPAVPQNTVLLKMTRENGTYEVRGYRFTKANPFLPVTEEAANYILENEHGFRIASPRDAQQFYS